MALEPYSAEQLDRIAEQLEEAARQFRHISGRIAAESLPPIPLQLAKREGHIDEIHTFALTLDGRLAAHRKKSQKLDQARQEGRASARKLKKLSD